MWLTMKVNKGYRMQCKTNSNIINVILFLMLAIAIFGACSAMAVSVDVFTTRSHPVTIDDASKDVVVQYYQLDQLHAVVNKINVAISGETGADARQTASTLLEKNKQLLVHSSTGLRKAGQYHISVIPTIVFDNGAYRVMGQTSLAVALGEYKTWLYQQ